MIHTIIHTDPERVIHSLLEGCLPPDVTHLDPNTPLIRGNKSLGNKSQGNNPQGKTQQKGKQQPGKQQQEAGRAGKAVTRGGEDMWQRNTSANIPSFNTKGKQQAGM